MKCFMNYYFCFRLCHYKKTHRSFHTAVFLNLVYYELFSTLGSRKVKQCEVLLTADLHWCSQPRN